MDDAPRRWWNIINNALCSYDTIPTRELIDCDTYCIQHSRPDWIAWAIKNVCFIWKNAWSEVQFQENPS